MSETEEQKIERLKTEIAAKQSELEDLMRYRYRSVRTKAGDFIRLRDDGYRIHFTLGGGDNWELWAEYKQCDLPAAGAAISDLLMTPQRLFRSDQIKSMVDRFLSWRMPEDLSPDGGLCYSKRNGVQPPTGTNLLDARQADAMVRYIVEGMS